MQKRKGVRVQEREGEQLRKKGERERGEREGGKGPKKVVKMSVCFLNTIMAIK